MIDVEGFLLQIKFKSNNVSKIYATHAAMKPAEEKTMRQAAMMVMDGNKTELWDALQRSVEQ